MKKVLAIILTVVMLFGVLAVSTSAEDTAEATPTVTLVTNAGSPVDKGVTTYFTVRFDNFSSIKGVDVTVTADQYIELGAVTAYGFQNDAALNSNYTEDNTEDTKHTIRFVDLTAGGNARIAFAATVPADADNSSDPTITVKGTYADSGTTLFDITAPATGSFELKKEIDTVVMESKTTEGSDIDLSTVVDTTKKFIPQGGVYIKNSDNTYTFATKQSDGSFKADAEGTYTYQSYDIPENKITTFGASDDPKDNTKLRFGNYSKKLTTTSTHGTMVFEGNWVELKNYYIKNGYTVQQFVKAIYNSASEKLSGTEKTYVYYKIPGTDETINVYLFAQKNYMWKNEDDGILEYAVRLTGMTSGTTYTGVAYTVDGETVTISENVKSVTKTAAESDAQ